MGCNASARQAHARAQMHADTLSQRVLGSLHVWLYRDFPETFLFSHAPESSFCANSLK